jgi:hypothetical protein
MGIVRFHEKKIFDQAAKPGINANEQLYNMRDHCTDLYLRDRIRAADTQGNPQNGPQSRKA